MAKNSAIQWTESTWNPWMGCRKVSPGCKYCYMFRDMDKYGMQPRVVSRSKTRFDAPLKWKEPRTIFTCSWSDFFIEEADQWRADAWQIVKATPQHTYQILTKRPERIEACLPEDWGAGGYSHVWLGVTVEDNGRMHRLEPLSRIDCAVRFASFEPLLERIDVTPYAHPIRLLDWAIIGGESGNDTGTYRYRECSLDWLTELADELKRRGVSVFVKQLGTHIAKQIGLKNRHGGDIAEFPKELQLRSMPDRKDQLFSL